MSERPGLRTGALALAALAIVAAVPVAWPPALLAVALTLTMAYAPGAALAPWLAPRAGTAGRTLFALSTAPFLTGGPAALLLALGVQPVIAARAILWGVAAVMLVAAWRGAPHERADRDHAGPVPWAAALIWTSGIAALLFANPWLATRWDGSFHAAVTLQMVERATPPEDPFFAGLRLLYFWGYHAWAAMWVAVAPRLTVWAPLLTLNLSGAFAVILGVCLIARRLGAGPRGMWAAAGVATLGYAPFSWVWLVARIFTGSVVGMPEFQRLAAGGTGPALQTMAAGTLHSSMVFFGDKYLVITSFALGLAQFSLLLLLLIDFFERPGWREGLALGLVEASAMFIHSVVGWSGALLAGGWWWWALWRSRRPEERHLRDVLLPLIAVFVAVVVLLLPYLAATTVGKQQSVQPSDPLLALGTWLLPGLLMVPFGMAWLWQSRRSVAGARDLFAFAVLLTVAGLTMSMPGSNQTKFFNLLLLLLAAPAALGLVAFLERLRAGIRLALVAALIVGIVPTVSIAVWAFATEHAQLGPDWEHPQPGEVEGVGWARAHTPANAVFVDSLLFLDLPVLAGRSVISAGPRWERNWSYPPRALELRRRAAHEAGALRVPSDSVASFLAGLDRPVYVVRRRRGADAAPGRWRAEVAAVHPGYALVHHNDDIAFFRWSPRP